MLCVCVQIHDVCIIIITVIIIFSRAPINISNNNSVVRAGTRGTLANESRVEWSRRFLTRAWIIHNGVTSSRPTTCRIARERVINSWQYFSRKIIVQAVLLAEHVMSSLHGSVTNNNNLFSFHSSLFFNSRPIFYAELRARFILRRSMENHRHCNALYALATTALLVSAISAEKRKTRDIKKLRNTPK